MISKQTFIRARIAEIKANGAFSARIFTKNELEELLKGGFVVKRNGKLALTDKGRKKVKVVMTGGAFDILHLGHVLTLENAKQHGDIIAVAVAHDETVKRSKKRPPIHTAKDRAKLLEKLKCVDIAIVGHPIDKMITVKRVKPDVVVYGYDQKADLRLEAKVKKLKKRLRGRQFKSSGIMEDM